jgi:hypothetical protein
VTKWPTASGPKQHCHALGLQEDIRLGKKLAAGGFGTVFRGDLLDVYPEAELPVVVKKVSHIVIARPSNVW